MYIRSDRHPGITALEYHHFSALQICGNRCERSLQFLDGLLVYGLIDVSLQGLPLDEATVRQHPVAYAVFFELERDLLQLESAESRRIKHADHATGTGADDQIGLYTLRLQHFDYAHMRKTAHRTATQHESNLG